MADTVHSNVPRAPVVGLVLPGGGARSAYQAGVLDGIARLCNPHEPAPFPVIVGTSAGSINAAYLAACVSEFAPAAARLCELWGNLEVEQVYRADTGNIFSVALRWLWTLMTRGLSDGNPRALLDNAPLRRLLGDNMTFADIQRNIDNGALRGLGITTAGYASERSLTWYQANREVQPWWRERREGRPATMTLEHIMASLALPIIFPAARIGDEWCGDGSTRQLAPLSPAIHLGAKKLLIIDTQYPAPMRKLNNQEEVPYPSFSRIAGYLLDTIFSDSLYADLERLEQINRILERRSAAAEGAEKLALHPIETMLITPSSRVVTLAARHEKALPKGIRWLLRALGDRGSGGDLLLSYMLFEAVYCRDLIELGRHDALARGEDLRRFLGISQTRTVPAEEAVPEKPALQ
ncbi:MAG: patatin-like phospholipase family protein [Gammaproteobacteria bacterium]